MSAVVGEGGARWQVLIVEDDAVVASVYARTVSADESLEVAGIVARGEDALAFVERRRCDLMLLDLRLAGMNGITLLHTLRECEHSPEVIAVTSTRSASAVRALAQRGAIDYLIKPFPVERLRQSLALFRFRASTLRNERLEQVDIDRICSSGRTTRRWLPKGLTEQGVARVRKALEVSGESKTAADIAAATGMARVTARRYLEYLAATEQVSVEALVAGPGRPPKIYRSLF
jgi:two-component system, CitB family, response regulator DctR